MSGNSGAVSLGHGEEIVNLGDLAALGEGHAVAVGDHDAVARAQSSGGGGDIPFTADKVDEADSVHADRVFSFVGNGRILLHRNAGTGIQGVHSLALAGQIAGNDDLAVLSPGAKVGSGSAGGQGEGEQSVSADANIILGIAGVLGAVAAEIAGHIDGAVGGFHRVAGEFRELSRGRSGGIGIAFHRDVALGGDGSVACASRFQVTIHRDGAVGGTHGVSALGRERRIAVYEDALFALGNDAVDSLDGGVTVDDDAALGALDAVAAEQVAFIHKVDRIGDMDGTVGINDPVRAAEIIEGAHRNAAVGRVNAGGDAELVFLILINAERGDAGDGHIAVAAVNAGMLS